MKRRSALLASPFSSLCFFLFLALPLYGKASNEEESAVMEKSEWRRITSSEYGQVSAIDVKDGDRAPSHLQFFTLEPNSLLLPVLLHADMLFYVHSGSGKLTWAFDDDTETINLRLGDIGMLGTGFVFYLQSNLESQQQKLRIFAFFPNTVHNHYDPAIGAYSRISELVGGFNQKIMQAAFGVPEELAAIISNKTETPAIVQAVSTKKKGLELEAWILNRVSGGEIAIGVSSSNNNKPRTINIFQKDPDFKNCHGWSLMGSMMGPHWNPLAAEMAMVLEGEGMVRVVCGNSNIGKSKCQNMRFRVKKGDVFMVPRFHPMAQMSFNNDSLVFLGFSTTTRKTYPQFLVGKRSVLHTIDKRILAISFNVSDTTIKQLLKSEEGSIILGCLSCAEEEERIMIEEDRKRAEEEARRREEEEARKREEEERKREEEEARKREEEEARRREEEEEARRREEEEEEARKREEEEEARRREEEERKREEEEARESEGEGEEGPGSKEEEIRRNRDN